MAEEGIGDRRMETNRGTPSCVVDVARWRQGGCARGCLGATGCCDVASMTSALASLSGDDRGSFP